MREAVIIGDAVPSTRDALSAALPPSVRLLDTVPLAATIARIAHAHPERATLPHAIIPLYVRRPDAELARDRRDRGEPSRRPRREPVPPRRRQPITPTCPSGSSSRCSSNATWTTSLALEAACFTNPTTRDMLRHEVESSDVLHAYVMRCPIRAGAA